jgi:steroid 5-alpha reductase family enzyme
MDWTVTITAVLAATAVMTTFWLISLAMRDAGIADVAWGLVFVSIGWACFLAGDGSNAMLLAAGLTTAWGLRLAIHIGRRNIGHEEDRRYTKMREKRPGTFWIWSLVGVFGVQGVIALLVSLPLQSLGAATPDSIGLLSWIGAAVFAIGLAFEGIGDAQLTAFKNDPSSKGQVMDRGLWRYTRHPNYFGDATVWWGIWVVAIGSGGAWWTAIGPVIMTFFLLRVSGVAMLESDMASRRPGYSEYIRRTSPFIPFPPRD